MYMHVSYNTSGAGNCNIDDDDDDDDASVCVCVCVCADSGVAAADTVQWCRWLGCWLLSTVFSQSDS